MFSLCSPKVGLQVPHVSITLELTEFQIETVLKALRNEADRDRAYRQMGIADTFKRCGEPDRGASSSD